MDSINLPSYYLLINPAKQGETQVRGFYSYAPKFKILLRYVELNRDVYNDQLQVIFIRDSDFLLFNKEQFKEVKI